MTVPDLGLTTPEAWWNRRRPELLSAFRDHVFGHDPPPRTTHGHVLAEDAELFGGPFVHRLVELRYGPPSVAPIVLSMFLPARATPAPVLLALNPCGNHTVVADPRIPISTRWVGGRCAERGTASEASRGDHADRWAIEATLRRGWAVATFHESDIEPDHPGARGIRDHLPVDAPPRSRWGTLAAWAYGLNRAVDYLAADADVDSDRIVVTGHSRRGKTALWAAATDERIAMCIAHQAGTGGATMLRGRGPEGESIEQITRRFPHWFAPAFASWSDREAETPLDFHMLLALVAPRPLLSTSADEDLWCDPPGARRAVELARPAWAMLGGDEATSMLRWLRRPGRHSLEARDWTSFIDVADGCLRSPR